MGSIDSWMFDKQVPYSVCLTGQMGLFMIVEDMELEGIGCFSFNTDGATFRVPKKKLDRFYEIWKNWESVTKLTLEETRFKSIRYSTVNDYLAIKDNGELKVKGDYTSDVELWKNKSNRVVALALQAYYKDGTNVEDFIKGHRNIYDFCIMARATKDLYLEMQSGERVHRLKKLVRYYISNGSEWQLFKRGIGSTGKVVDSNVHAPNEVGVYHVQYFNQWEDKKWEDYAVDVDQYIFKTLSMIDNVEKTDKAKKFLLRRANTNQLSLF